LAPKGSWQSKMMEREMWPMPADGLPLFRVVIYFSRGRLFLTNCPAGLEIGGRAAVKKGDKKQEGVRKKQQNKSMDGGGNHRQFHPRRSAPPHLGTESILARRRTHLDGVGDSRSLQGEECRTTMKGRRGRRNASPFETPSWGLFSTLVNIPSTHF
jgi:hypothetical protein